MKHIKGFNALRAFSVALVVITHLDLSDWIPNTDFVWKRVWPMISGGFGVQIFFVLSGFLISSILLNELKEKSKINFKNFFARRFLRLLPPLLVFFILLGIANMNGLLMNAKDSILYAVFYIYNFVPREYYSLEMGHFWSLGVEEQFYILWPFTLSFFSKIKIQLLVVGSLIVACCFVVMTLDHWEINTTHYVGRWFIPASCPILVGCMGAILNHHYTETLKKWFSNTFLVVIVILATYAFTLYAPLKIVSLGIFVQSVSVIMLLLLVYHSQEKRWVKAMEFKPLAYLGIISYGIYVYQGFFLRTGGGSELWFQQFPQNIVFTILLAILSYEFIEKPILKLKRKFQ